MSTTLTVTYKDQTLTYELFHEVCDFVQDVDGLDGDVDFVKIERIAQRLDRKAVRAS